MSGTGTKVICGGDDPESAAWSQIKLSRKDTAETQRQVLIHNETGRRLGCW